MQKRRHTTWIRWSALIGAASLVALSSCSTFSTIGGPPDIHNGLDHVDPALNLTREDYRNMGAPKEGDKAPVLRILQEGPPIPKLAEILATPRPPKIGETQLVSIAVTDDVPLKDVLLELAKLADIDIELDAGISGGISFIAKDKPFNEVVDRIADLAGLRYTMKNGVLRVERDTPYIQSYSVDFLNMDRDSDSSVSLSTNVLSSGGSGGSGGAGGLTTGSTSSVKSKTSGDFWKSLESGVTQILAYKAPDHVSDTTLQAETDTNVLTALTGTPAAGGAAGAGAAAATTPTGAAGGKTPAPAPAPAPAAAPKAAAADSGAGKGGYTINRQAGVLTVNATGKQHELIATMLGRLKSNASAQVLIEAKIIEVALNETYQSGIDWQGINKKMAIAGTFSNTLINPAAGNVLPFGVFNASTPTGNGVSFAVDNSRDILNMLETFGTSRTLSSPRLHAINNQQSTMTFAKNQVYFTLTITPPTTTTTGTVSTTPSAPTITSTLNTVPIGIMMTMMPSIDLEDNDVTLAVRPTLSTLVGEVPDPAATIAAKQAGLASLTSNIPVIQVRELDSTLKLRSGQTMVIGGLMQQTSQTDDQGVPFASGLPVIGNLFKSVGKTNENTELVLLIKATIVNSGGSLNKTDATIFHKFSNDPRPVSF